MEFDTFSRLYIAGKDLDDKILQTIRAMPGVLEVVQDPKEPDAYTIKVKEEKGAEVLARELNHKLAKSGIYLSRLELIKPSLEELFMKITRGT